MSTPARKFLILLVLLFPLCASALIMTENGPEPILVQVKQSIRLDPNLDAQLQDLAALETSLGLSVTERWVNPQAYLELLTFPADFTYDQAISVVDRLQQSTEVQQTATASAFNLFFPLSYFSGEFGPNEDIPEVVRRGLDTPSAPPVDPSTLEATHVPNQLIVSWKPEFIWNAAETGFLQTMADFNAAAGCRVVSNIYSSATELSQVLEFNPRKNLLLDELIRYTNSGFVSYTQPNFLADTTAGDDILSRHSHRGHRKMRAVDIRPPQ
jgi:hypothetical protein